MLLTGFFVSKERMNYKINKSPLCFLLFKCLPFCWYLACHYLIVMFNLDQTFAYQAPDNKDLKSLDLTGISSDQTQILLTTLHMWSVILLREFKIMT